MRLPLGACLLVVVCLLVEGLEARRHGEHHGHHSHRKRGKKNGHGHHTITGEETGNRLTTASNKLKIQTVKIGWLNVPKVMGCRCRHEGAICIRGPDGEPTCVQKHHLKESARLFKHYHELKEKAEEDLNEVDPVPHEVLRDAPFRAPLPHSDDDAPSPPHHAPHHHEGAQDTPAPEAPHDMLISVVNQHRSDRRMLKNQCDNATLDEMRRRLTGWFHLLHKKERHRENHHHHRSHRHLSVKKELRDASEAGRCDCLRSVMWEFHQIDADRSRSLSRAEVKVIDNNDMEPCLHPYLLSCDRNSDGLLSHREWCCCFPQKESESPCYARLDEIEPTKNTEKYIPSCDHEGYFHREQCMGGPLAQTCWCVTPTGSEIPGTRSVGRAHCGKVDDFGNPLNNS